jgi:hypothetical protein
MLESNAPKAALDLCETLLRQQPQNPFILMYKADALLSLERWDECEWTLQQLNDNISVTSAITEEEILLDFHEQLLNNHAVALAAQGHVELAMSKLRDCLRRYPASLQASFNLTLLLWRHERFVDACVLWLQTNRGTADELLSIEVTGTSITSKQHITPGLHGGVNPAHIRALDQLIQAHWNQHTNRIAIKRALQVMYHLADACV